MIAVHNLIHPGSTVWFIRSTSVRNPSLPRLTWSNDGHFVIHYHALGMHIHELCHLYTAQRTIILWVCRIQKEWVCLAHWNPIDAVVFLKCIQPKVLINCSFTCTWRRWFLKPASSGIAVDTRHSLTIPILSAICWRNSLMVLYVQYVTNSNAAPLESPNLPTQVVMRNKVIRRHHTYSYITRWFLWQ